MCLLTAFHDSTVTSLLVFNPLAEDLTQHDLETNEDPRAQASKNGKYHVENDINPLLNSVNHVHDIRTIDMWERAETEHDPPRALRSPQNLELFLKSIPLAIFFRC